jgi:hypothetical protein
VLDATNERAGRTARRGRAASLIARQSVSPWWCGCPWSFGSARDPGATCQQPGCPSLPQQVERVRSFRQLLASARRTFVGNGASKVEKLVKKAFRFGRAMASALLLRAGDRRPAARSCRHTTSSPVLYLTPGPRGTAFSGPSPRTAALAGDAYGCGVYAVAHNRCSGVGHDHVAGGA